MHRKTLSALKGSIKKWDEIATSNGEDHGRANCPLCKEFWGQGCHGCPVKEETGQSYCGDSPYSEWGDHMVHNHNSTMKAVCDRCVHFAEKERDFLKSLLPETPREEIDYEET